MCLVKIGSGFNFRARFKPAAAVFVSWPDRTCMVASDQLGALATYGNADKVACAWVPSSESGAISITL